LCEESYGGSKCGEENNGRKKVVTCQLSSEGATGRLSIRGRQMRASMGRRGQMMEKEFKVGGKVWFGAKSKGEERRRDKTRFSPEAKNLEVGFRLTFRAFDQWQWRRLRRFCL
jgi:hypothetical protein